MAVLQYLKIGKNSPQSDIHMGGTLFGVNVSIFCSSLGSDQNRYLEVIGSNIWLKIFPFTANKMLSKHIQGAMLTTSFSQMHYHLVMIYFQTSSLVCFPIATYLYFPQISVSNIKNNLRQDYHGQGICLATLNVVSQH